MEISIDSRSVIAPEATMFFALKGKNHDGHDYVQGLYERGVRDFVISEKRKEFAGLKEARFYLQPMSEEEFDPVPSLSRVIVYALHKRD